MRAPFNDDQPARRDSRTALRRLTAGLLASALALCFGGAAAAGDANNGIISVTGTAGLSTVGNQVTGTFTFTDGAVVGYTLRLLNMTGTYENGGVNWNGAFNSESSPTPAFSWDDTAASDADSWMVELTFTRPVQLTWRQSVNQPAGANHTSTGWDMTWSTAAMPTINDPMNQLDNETIGAGSAHFEMALAVGNTEDQWQIVGPYADRITIKATEFVEAVTDTEWLAIESGSAAPNTWNMYWRNLPNDLNGAWMMAGTERTSACLAPNPADSSWDLVGAADLDNDGKRELLWRNQTNNLASWTVNGCSITSSAYIGIAPGSVWDLAATGDLDGDGKDDIIYRNFATGENAIWFMNGNTVASSESLPAVADTAWQVVGAGDFNGDGKADLVWLSIYGDVAVWFMNRTTVLGAASIATFDTAGYQIVAVHDFNGDKNADIIFHSPISGDVAAWLMQGTTVRSGEYISRVVDSSWSVIGAR